jgi:hypothetical protein
MIANRNLIYGKKIERVKSYEIPISSTQKNIEKWK